MFEDTGKGPGDGNRGCNLSHVISPVFPPETGYSKYSFQISHASTASELVRNAASWAHSRSVDSECPSKTILVAFVRTSKLENSCCGVMLPGSHSNVT